MSLADAAVVVSQSRPRALGELSAREIAARIAARDLSSSEVVAHFVGGLKAVDGALNAVTADLSERAHALAAMTTIEAAARTNSDYPARPPL